MMKKDNKMRCSQQKKIKMGLVLSLFSFATIVYAQTDSQSSSIPAYLRLEKN